MAVIIKYKEALLNVAEKQKADTDELIVNMNLLQKAETLVIKLY